MNKKFFISLAALAAAVITLASPIASGHTSAMPAPDRIPLANDGGGGGP